MKRGAVLCIALLMSGAAQAADLESLEMEQFYRYLAFLDPRTEIPFTNKEGTAELRRRGEPAVRFLMDRAQVRSVWISVYLRRIIKPDAELRYADILFEYLESEDPEVRRMALANLAYYEIPDRTEALVPHLAHDRTRNATIKALGKWKAGDQVDDLLPYLKHERESARIVTANALGDIGDPSAASALVEALDDPLFTVRNAAGRSLVLLGDKAGEAAYEVLSDTTSVRQTRQIVRVLGALKYRKARRQLRRYLEHEDEGLQRDAFRALAEMEKKEREKPDETQGVFDDLIYLLAEEPDTLHDFLGVEGME